MLIPVKRDKKYTVKIKKKHNSSDTTDLQHFLGIVAQHMLEDFTLGGCAFPTDLGSLTVKYLILNYHSDDLSYYLQFTISNSSL